MSDEMSRAEMQERVRKTLASDIEVLRDQLAELAHRAESGQSVAEDIERTRTEIAKAQSKLELFDLARRREQEIETEAERKRRLEEIRTDQKHVRDVGRKIAPVLEHLLQQIEDLAPGMVQLSSLLAEREEAMSRALRGAIGRSRDGSRWMRNNTFPDHRSQIAVALVAAVARSGLTSTRGIQLKPWLGQPHFFGIEKLDIAAVREQLHKTQAAAEDRISQAIERFAGGGA